MEFTSKEAAEIILDMSSDLSDLSSEEDTCSVDCTDYLSTEEPLLPNLPPSPVIDRNTLPQPDIGDIATDVLLDADDNPAASQKKKKHIREKYPLLSPCDCKKKCHENIAEEARQVIHDKFWSIDSKSETCGCMGG